MVENKITILLIEDNDDDATYFEELLKESPSFQYAIVCYTSLCQTLEQIDSITFDIVISDLSLPDARGLDILHSLKQDLIKTPIVVLTGLDDEKTAIEAVRNGAQDYLVKSSLNSDMLIRTIRYALERNNLQTQLNEARIRQMHEKEYIKIEELFLGRIVTMSSSQITTHHRNLEQSAELKMLTDHLWSIIQNNVSRSNPSPWSVISNNIKSVSDRLFALSAGSRETLFLVKYLFKYKIEKLPVDQWQNYIDDIRMILIELLCNLVTAYQHKNT